ncbi:MAG: site-specific integrase [Betaproteobacteria bacterium]|nr:site-specific integrase [Betaproteobacteria bacterium]
MGTIRVRGAYQYQAQVRRAGFPPQSKTFENRRDAEKWVRSVEREMDTGAFIPRDEAARTTINDLAKKYREELLPKQRGKRQEDSRLKAVEDKFSGFNLSAVTPAMVAKWRDELSKKLAPQTVQHYLAVLNRLYKAAARDFGIPLPLGNPVAAVRMPTISNARERRLEGDEETRLLAALDASRGKHLKAVALLALETAMRRGELLALRWEFVDLKRRVVHLPETKNGSTRDVPLSTTAVAVLEGVPRNIAGRVFGTSETAITEGFQRAVKRAGLPDFRFHDLRHEATSRMAEKLQMHELGKVTGHRSARMLMRYYHPRAEDLALKLG